jgi:hypothetical protein
MNDKINKTTYSIKKLSEIVGVGNRKSWKNFVTNENYSTLFKEVKGYGIHVAYETELSVDELRIKYKEYVYNLRIRMARLGVETRKKNKLLDN